MERLQKLIAHAGIASRRSAEDMIRAGRVSVDGELAHLGQKIDPETAAVEVDGIPLPVKPDQVYLLLNKPAGVVSTTDDPQGRTTVIDLVETDLRVYPVGRLDADSEGLMLLTNDGDLTERITHPRYGVTKTYLALVEGKPAARVMRLLVEGIELDDGAAAARAARVVDRNGDAALVEIVMTEGRNREVRRMLEAAGHPVRRLMRTALGPITDRTIKPGEWRHLTIAEVRKLYAAGNE
ncbi:MAG: pseudouridine synthase [Acidimicrobiia bacterium]